MIVIEKGIVAVFLQLSELGSLLEEIVINMLKGLTNFLFPDFMKLYLFLQQAKAKAHETDTSEGSTLDWSRLF